MRYIYILECSDTSLYTGITTDIHRRVQEHNSSSFGAKYTKARRPVRLVRSQEAENRSHASKLELFVKKKTKNKKKELIEKNMSVTLPEITT